MSSAALSTVRVAVVVNLTMGYGRHTARGVLQRAREAGWSPAIVQPQHLLSFFNTWRGNGLIFHSGYARQIPDVLKHNLPIVQVNNAARLTDYLVHIHDRCVGRLAAEHFLERGFQSFAFAGPSKLDFSFDRLAGFRNRLEQQGYTCACFDATFLSPGNESGDWFRPDSACSDWLKTLPLPVGVLACNDTKARSVVASCVEAGLSIPHDVAILGVDDDDLICEAMDPPLSSVQLPLQALGYEAARLIERAIAGEPAAERPLLLEPIGVTTRQSTEVLATADPDVRLALAYIRDHLDEPLGVDEVVAQTGVSRRVLESRFRKEVGRPIYDYILAGHLQRAATLLQQTSLSVAEVGQRCGFRSVAHFSKAFRRHHGQAPSAMRSAVRR